MAIREYTCLQVVAGKVCGNKGTQTGGGPLRDACDDCRKRKDSARKRRARSSLAVVEEPPVAEAPVSPPVPAPPLPDEPAQPRVSVRAGVDEFLACVDVGVAGGPALRAMAKKLAAACDGRAADADPRILATLTRELRETLKTMTSGEEDAGSGDPLDNLRPSLVNPSAS